MKLPIKKWCFSILRPVLTVIVALLIGSLLVLPTGTSPLEAYRALFIGAFGSPTAILNTLMRATPLLFCGLSACIALKSGVFNIGLEGQLYLGGITSALVACWLDFLPGFLLIPVAFLAAGAAGVLWSVIPAFLKEKLGVNLVITSIMMNNIAVLFTTYLSTYVFKGDLPISATPKIPEHAMLPKFSIRSDFNIGFFLAVLIAVLLFVLIYKTSFGYECRALGLNANFTNYIGVDVSRRALAVMFISAFIAGLGGAEQSLGVNNMFISNFSPGYGFTGITVVLLGGMHPFGVIVGAIFFGALTSGAIQMEVMTSVSRDLINTIQAVIILLLAADGLFRFGMRRRKRAGKKSSDTGKEAAEA